MAKSPCREAIKRFGRWRERHAANQTGSGAFRLYDLPRLAPRYNMDPAQRMSLVHHRDVATSVNIADEAPTSIYELAELAGGTMETSSAPLATPWHLHVDTSLGRRLGFRSAVLSIHHAAEEGLL